MPKYHPTPWRVEYYRRCPEWHEKSRPRIKDANNCIVCEMPMNVGHPGEYDFIADKTAHEIIAAVNGPCPECNGTGGVDSGGATHWGAFIDIPCPACSKTHEQETSESTRSRST